MFGRIVATAEDGAEVTAVCPEDRSGREEREKEGKGQLLSHKQWHHFEGN